MSNLENRTRSEPFSDGTARGYTLVKSVPIKPPLIACMPTFIAMQPAGACEVGETPIKVLTFVRNGVRKTITVDASNAMQSEDGFELLTLFQNASKKGQAFITLQDAAPVLEEVSAQLMLSSDGDGYVEAPMSNLYDEELGTLMSGIGSDGAVVTSGPISNVIGTGFNFMSGVDIDPGPGVSYDFQFHEFLPVTEGDLVIEETVLSFERTPGASSADDLFNGFFSSDASSPVTIRSCAYIKFPEVIVCIPTDISYSYASYGLAPLTQAANSNEMRNALVGCLIQFNGYNVLSLVQLNNVDTLYLNSGWANTTPITFHEGSTDMISGLMSYNHGIEVNTGLLSNWTGRYGSNELRRIAMVKEEFISDRLGWVLKGFGIGDSSLMYDQIMNQSEDFVSFTKESTEITLTKLPPEVLNIINPNNRNLGYVDYVDIFNSGQDITIHSCNRMNASDSSMDVFGIFPGPGTDMPA